MLTESSDGGLNSELERYEQEIDAQEGEEGDFFLAQEESMPETDIENEMAYLEEINAEQAAKKEKESRKKDKKVSLNHLHRLLCALYREGAEGAIQADLYPFLSPFKMGIENAWEQIKDQASDLFMKVEEEMKSSYWRRQNKQKPIKQRIKQSIAEKKKREQDKYVDFPFVLEVTKEFCYKTGMRISVPVSQKIKNKREERSKLNTKVHEKMQGFYSPVAGYVWEDEKINCFIESVRNN